VHYAVYTQYMAIRAYRIAFWLCAAASAACFVVGGWLWWSESDAPLLLVDTPLIEVAAISRGQARKLEIAVTNPSSHPLRLAGLDGELC
jgi:hypothetical protein